MQNNLEEFKNYLRLNDYSKSYLRPVRRYLNYCDENNVNVLEADYNSITKYLLFLKERIKNGSLNMTIFAIKFYYRFLRDTKTPIRPDLENELSKIRGLKVERVIKETINFKEVDKLIERALSYDYKINPYKFKALMYFMFYTGVRSNELLNLKRSEFNLEEKTAFIRVPTKNKSERLVYYPDKVAQILKKFFRDEPEILNAFNITQSQLKRLFLYLKNFNSKISPHLMRHSFTQLLAYKGIDIRIAQELLGHKSLASTLIYYNPNKETVRKIYRQKIGS